MTNRVIDISESAARLKVRQKQLLIELGDERARSIPLEDMGVLVVSHPSVIMSHAVLAGLAENGAIFVGCDRARMPTAMLLPLQSHHLQAERFRWQAQAPLTTCKRIWQQIVRAKIAAQGRALRDFHGDDKGLAGMVRRVRSGDPDNVEAQASRRYWTALFGEAFRRDRDAPGPNRYLNYGYAVLRAIVARGICAAGLHPALGIHHHNRYSGFPLADDLMEPYRPLVDRAVYRLVQESGAEAELVPETKAVLIAALLERYPFEGEQRSLFELTTRTAVSLACIFNKIEKKLVVPEL